MKKLLFLLLFIPLVSFGQSISDNEEVNSFDGLTLQTIIKDFKKMESEEILKADGSSFFKIRHSSAERFVYTLGENTTYEYDFNSKGDLIQHRTIYWTNKSDWDNLYLEKKTLYYEYDSNPKQSNKNIPLDRSSARGYNYGLLQGTILKPVIYNLIYKDYPTNVTIGKYLVRKYRESFLKGVGQKRLEREFTGIIEIFEPNKNAKKQSSKTWYNLFDLKDDDMKYNLKNYVLAFLFDISSPQTFLLRDYDYDILEFHNNHDYELNRKDKHFIESFFDAHKNMHSMGDYVGEYSDDEICPKDLYDLKINIEYKTLDDDRLAYAVGTIFKNKEIRIVVDPKKMSEASPSKRAYVMYHELFHTLGIIHGECGPMMFPYVEKEYTWNDFSKGKIEAFECFVSMRNYLQRDDPNATKKVKVKKSNPVDVANELIKLKELLDLGIITQDEYDKKAAELKKTLLGGN